MSMEPITTLPEVVHLAQVHRWLPVSKRIAYELRQQGRLRCIKIAGRWFVRRSEIERILREGTDQIVEAADV